MRYFRSCLASTALFLLFVVIAAQAQTEQQARDQNYFNSVYLSLGLVNINSEQARREYIADNANAVRLAFEGQRSNLVFAAGVSGFIYEDKTGNAYNLVNSNMW